MVLLKKTLILLMFILLLDVAIAVDFYPAGNIQMRAFNVNGTGNVTASYYFGDGSQLTGISAGSGNTSWNQTHANTLYANIANVSVIQALVVSNSTLFTQISNINGTVNTLLTQNTTNSNRITALETSNTSTNTKIDNINITLESERTRISNVNSSLNIVGLLNNANVTFKNLTVTGQSIFNDEIRVQNSSGKTIFVMNSTTGYITIGNDTLPSGNGGVNIAGNNYFATGGTTASVGENYGGYTWRMTTSMAGNPSTNTRIVSNRTNNPASGDSSINFYVAHNAASRKILALGVNGTSEVLYGNFSVYNNMIIGAVDNSPTQTLVVVGTANITGALTLGNSICSTGTVLATNSTGHVGCVPFANDTVTVSALVSSNTTTNTKIDNLNASKVGLIRANVTCGSTDKLNNITINASGIFGTCGTDTGGSGGVGTLRTDNTSYLIIDNGSTTNITINLSGFLIPSSNLINLPAEAPAGNNFVTQFNGSNSIVRAFDPLKEVYDGTNITTGTVADARIASTITRDTEVPSLETDPHWSANLTRVTALETSNTSTNTKIDNLNSSTAKKNSSNVITGSQISCLNITGTGSDTDFCVDASGAGGGGADQNVNTTGSPTFVQLNLSLNGASITQNLTKIQLASYSSAGAPAGPNGNVSDAQYLWIMNGTTSGDVLNRGTISANDANLRDINTPTVATSANCMTNYTACYLNDGSNEYFRSNNSIVVENSNYSMFFLIKPTQNLTADTYIGGDYDALYLAVLDANRTLKAQVKNSTGGTGAERPVQVPLADYGENTTFRYVWMVYNGTHLCTQDGYAGTSNCTTTGFGFASEGDFDVGSRGGSAPFNQSYYQAVGVWVNRTLNSSEMQCAEQGINNGFTTLSASFDCVSAGGSGSDGSDSAVRINSSVNSSLIPYSFSIGNWTHTFFRVLSIGNETQILGNLTVNGAAMIKGVITQNGVQVLLASGFAGENITSGTVADARIASTIARDSEILPQINQNVNNTGSPTFVGGLFTGPLNVTSTANFTNITMSGNYVKYWNGSCIIEKINNTFNNLCP